MRGHYSAARSGASATIAHAVHQRMKLALLALALAVAACSSKSEDKPPTPAAAPAPGSAAPVETAPARPARPAAAAAAVAVDKSAVASAPSDFPAECRAYADLIDKLKDCDKLGGARAGLSQGYDNVRSAWAVVPAERHGEIATQCKTQADSLRNAAAATCGW